jgi:hypothetical protein
MRLNTLLETDRTTSRALNVFSLYVDFPAGLRAKWAASQITRRAGKRWEVSAQVWKLDSFITAGSIRNLICEEAAQADVLVVALSSLDQPEQEVIAWLKSLAPARQPDVAPGGLLLGLLGDDEHWVKAKDPMVQQLAAVARRRNMDFGWQWMERDAMEDSEWLTGRVEQLLDRKQSARLFENGSGLALL